MLTATYPSRSLPELARTQVYLSSVQISELSSVSKQTAQSKSELIRIAIDQFLEQRKAQELRNKKSKIHAIAGLWAKHDDKADVAAYVRSVRQPRKVAEI